MEKKELILKNNGFQIKIRKEGKGWIEISDSG